MTRISLTAATDGMKAFLTVPESMVQQYPSTEDLKNTLKGYGVVHGVVDSALEAMARDKPFNVPVEVARGAMPVHGVPGRIDILVDVSLRGKPRVLAGGRVDHRDLSYVVNVRKNTPLLRRIPPVPGKNGQTVFGKPVPYRQPPPVSLLCGPGTRISPQDPDLLVADIDGAVMVYPNGKAEVLTEKVVSSDIDYSTGNIFFTGNLVIKGTVRSGFEVEAEGNVWIGGAVEDAKVGALADVEITGGASASGSGLLKCGGVLKARHLQNLTAQATHIMVAEDIVHCNIWAEKTVRAKSIVGGTVSAGDEIEAESIGTSAEARTVIDLGGMTVLLKQKYDLLRDLANVTGEVGSVKEAMFKCVRDTMDAAGNLPAQALVRLDGLKKKNAECSERCAGIQKDIELLDEKLNRKTVPVLRAEVVYPNTVVKAGTLEKTIKEKVLGAVISADQNGITIGRS